MPRGAPVSAVNRPRHYNAHPSNVEAIEICEHLDFCVGNAIKYLFRVGLKDDPIQDLKKALWYLNRAAPDDYNLAHSTHAQNKAWQVFGAEPIGTVLSEALGRLLCPGPQSLEIVRQAVGREIANREAVAP